MKKLLLLLFGAFLLSTSVSAKVLVPLTVCIEEDEQPGGNGHGDHPEYVLYIKDENNNVVYTTTVYSTQTQVILPSSLSGDYKIQLDFGGNYFFVGKIEL